MKNLMTAALQDEPGEDIAQALEDGWLPIREVARQTGVNAVTLRAWERRYGLIVPQRTPKGHRLFSHDHVQRIHTILTWLNRGVPVSQVKNLIDSAHVAPDAVENEWHTLRQTRLYRAQIHAQLSEREQSRAALREEATHDPLTGLANRRLFYDRLQQAIRHAQRYGGHLGLLYVDVDRFKTINDVHGHHVGDNVLVEVSRQLKSCVRDSDTVARLGGDEFVILLEGVQGRQDCIAAAQKIEEALASNALFNEWQIDVEASIGQSLYPADGSDEDSLIRAADAAMYRMKSGGTSRQQTALPF